MLFTPRAQGEVINEIAGMTLNDWERGLGDAIRVRMEISGQDYDDYHEYGNGEYGYAVTDQNTGIVVRVRRADCGLGCRCAAEIVEVVENPIKAEWDREMAERLAKANAR